MATLSADKLLNDAFGQDHIDTHKGERLIERRKISPKVAAEVVRVLDNRNPIRLYVATQLDDGSFDKTIEKHTTQTTAILKMSRMQREAKHGSK